MPDQVAALSHGVSDTPTQRAIRALETALNDALARIISLEARVTALEAYNVAHP